MMSANKESGWCLIVGVTVLTTSSYLVNIRHELMLLTCAAARVTTQGDYLLPQIPLIQLGGWCQVWLGCAGGDPEGHAGVSPQGLHPVTRSL